MKNTDFMNLSLPEGADKIDVEILNSDFTAIENLLKQHAIIETMTLIGEGVIIGAIGPYIRLQNIDVSQVSIDIGKETYTLASGENVIIRETAENIGIITSGNVHITYFVNPKTYADKAFYTKEKVDELLSNVEATVEVDTELSETSENPVQNKVITAELARYATTAEVESKVTEKVAEIVAGAPEDFDTLKEMSDWLTEHEDSAATMNAAIQQNKTDIATANTNIQKNVYDISNVNVQIADIYNRCSGGKNVYDFKNTNETSSYGLTYTKTDESLILTESSRAYARVAFNLSMLPIGRYNVSFMVSDIECESNTAKVLISKNADGTDAIGTSVAISDNIKYTFGFNVTSTKQNNYIIFYGNYSGTIYNNKLSISEIMVSPDKIKNDTYAPYIPTNEKLYEQINALTMRIAALEGTATTEGGE